MIFFVFVLHKKDSIENARLMAFVCQNFPGKLEKSADWEKRFWALPVVKQAISVCP